MFISVCFKQFNTNVVFGLKIFRQKKITITIMSDHRALGCLKQKQNKRKKNPKLRTFFIYRCHASVLFIFIFSISLFLFIFNSFFLLYNYLLYIFCSFNFHFVLIICNNHLL